MLSSILLYVMIAVVFGIALMSVDEEWSYTYRVESNRFMQKLSMTNQLEAMNIQEYENLKTVDFIEADEKNKKHIENFYQDENNTVTQIQPWYENDQLKGYVKLSFEVLKDNTWDIFILFQTGLLLLEGMILAYLQYMKIHIVKPFQKLRELPIQLAKGHYKGNVKEDKNRYLGKFLWGMSQLKDTLDKSNKRQLQLLEEKKKMLLSLSHDIKTPLNLIKLYAKALGEDIYIEEVDKKNAVNQIGIKVIDIENYVDQIIKSSHEDILDIQVYNADFYLSELIAKVKQDYDEQCSLRQIQLYIHKFDDRLLKGDIERSQEILENLFENAFKYGDGKKIEISFYEEDYCQLIRFHNTGSIVEEHEFTHIFESFFRGSNSHGKPGNGLGLYICRELMRKMNGDIFAEITENGMAITLVFH